MLPHTREIYPSDYPPSQPPMQMQGQRQGQGGVERSALLQHPHPLPHPHQQGYYTLHPHRFEPPTVATYHQDWIPRGGQFVVETTNDPHQVPVRYRQNYVHGGGTVRGGYSYIEAGHHLQQREQYSPDADGGILRNRRTVAFMENARVYPVDAGNSSLQGVPDDELRGRKGKNVNKKLERSRSMPRQAGNAKKGFGNGGGGIVSAAKKKVKKMFTGNQDNPKKGSVDHPSSSSNVAESDKDTLSLASKTGSITGAPSSLPGNAIKPTSPVKRSVPVIHGSTKLVQKGDRMKKYEAMAAKNRGKVNEALRNERLEEFACVNEQNLLMGHVQPPKKNQDTSAPLSDPEHGVAVTINTELPKNITDQRSANIWGTNTKDIVDYKQQLAASRNPLGSLEKTNAAAGSAMKKEDKERSGSPVRMGRLPPQVNNKHLLNQESFYDRLADYSEASIQPIVSSSIYVPPPRIPEKDLKFDMPRQPSASTLTLSSTTSAASGVRIRANNSIDSSTPEPNPKRFGDVFDVVGADGGGGGGEDRWADCGTPPLTDSTDDEMSKNTTGVPVSKRARALPTSPSAYPPITLPDHLLSQYPQAHQQKQANPHQIQAKSSDALSTTVVLNSTPINYTYQHEHAQLSYSQSDTATCRQSVMTTIKSEPGDYAEEPRDNASSLSSDGLFRRALYHSSASSNEQALSLQTNRHMQSPSSNLQGSSSSLVESHENLDRMACLWNLQKKEKELVAEIAKMTGKCQQLSTRLSVIGHEMDGMKQDDAEPDFAMLNRNWELTNEVAVKEKLLEETTSKKEEMNHQLARIKAQIGKLIASGRKPPLQIKEERD